MHTKHNGDNAKLRIFSFISQRHVYNPILWATHTKQTNITWITKTKTSTWVSPLTQSLYSYIWGQRIHVGMNEMYEIADQATYRFFGIYEMYKLVMDGMYEIVWTWFFWNWFKSECENSRICIVSVVREQTLC